MRPTTLKVGPLRSATALAKALGALPLTMPDRAALNALQRGLWREDVYRANLIAIASGYLPEYCRIGYGGSDTLNGERILGVWPFSDVFGLSHGRYCLGEIAGSRETATAEDCYAAELDGAFTLYRRQGRGNRWRVVWSVLP